MKRCSTFHLKTIVSITLAFGAAAMFGACDDEDANPADNLDAGSELDTTVDVDVADEDDTDTSETCVAAEAAEEALAPVDAVAEHSAVFETTDGVTTGTLDAFAGGLPNAATNPWVYLDLQTGAVLDITDVEALSSDQWDLAFKRTEIRLNGGDSGPGAWFAARIDDTTWESAPRPGRDAEYVNDDFVDDETCELNTFGRGSLLTAFGQWYDYDLETRVISAPDDTVYALYTMSDHSVWRFQIQGYDRETATYTLRWSRFPAPEGI